MISGISNDPHLNREGWMLAFVTAPSDLSHVAGRCPQTGKPRTGFGLFAIL